MAQDFHSPYLSLVNSSFYFMHEQQERASGKFVVSLVVIPHQRRGKN